MLSNTVTDVLFFCTTGTGESNKVRNIIIAVVSTVCFVTLIICIIIFFRMRKRKQRFGGKYVISNYAFDAIII